MPKTAQTKREPLFDEVERDALRCAIKALEQKAESIASFGPFASKGPIMRNKNAAAELRRILRRKQ